MLTRAPFELTGRRTLLLCDGSLSQTDGKTAVCYLMYRGEDVVAVLDASRAGRTASDVLGFGPPVPIVESVEAALSHRPEVAIVGTAPMGGALTAALRADIEACLHAGVDIVSGMHTFLAEDAALTALARVAGARIWDARRVEAQTRVSTGVGCTTGARVVLLVGSDCNVGKMTAAVELWREAERRGLRASWAATGQTGIMLRGRGVAVDRVVSDFVGGAAEELVNEEGAGVDYVFVEGQGSIVHPGYAGVTLGLMFGCMPDVLVMAHTADRNHFKRLDGLALPPMKDMTALHESLMRPFKDTRVCAIAVNTSCLDESAARRFIEGMRNDTGLACTDVVRFGSAPVLDAVVQAVTGEQ